jgi:hypothetical protein
MNLLLLVQKGFFHSVLSTCKKKIKINITYIIFLEKNGKTCDETIIGPFSPFPGTFDLAYLPINSADIGFLSEVMLKHTAPHDIDDAKASNVDLNNNKQTTLKLLHS